MQACLPVKWLDRGYNLKPTHDFKSAFMIVDHDETDEALARLPIGNIFAPGPATSSGACGVLSLYISAAHCIHFPDVLCPTCPLSFSLSCTSCGLPCSSQTA